MDDAMAETVLSLQPEDLEALLAAAKATEEIGEVPLLVAGAVLWIGKIKNQERAPIEDKGRNGFRGRRSGHRASERVQSIR
ncbi:MAG: hypothetical protein M1830_003497 [Pleopsidium flavum]|nr:MAG: hypothetical protein M1830_003497 [Pleopsidium flavum]